MLKKGSILNEFSLLKRLGAGAFGEVWLAENQVAVGNDPRHVALKIPRDQDRVELLPEAQTLAKLRHPCIVRLIRPGRTSDGLLFLVMEYMPGGSLAAKLKEGGQLQERKAVDFLDRILLALQYLHANGCLHLDIKPDNILFDEEGNVKLADFGIAKFLSSKSHIDYRAGTPSYMAPEVYKGEARPASDLWSMGILVHQMLSGELPFNGLSLENLMWKICNEAPVLSTTIGAPMLEIIQKALQKDHRSRYQSASAMRDALQLAALAPSPEEIRWKRQLDLLAGPATALIVVGTFYPAEINERWVASLIQDRLMSEGQMAIVMTDVEYLENRALFARHPIISIGGCRRNKVTHELDQSLQVDESIYACLGRRIVRVDRNVPPKAVIWGGGHLDTLQAAFEFLRDGLNHFIRPKKDVTRVVMSPHINDAFLSLGSCLSRWHDAGTQVRVVDVFSNTNFTAFYTGATSAQPTAAISLLRKYEELSNALAGHVEITFLDLPEAMIREHHQAANNLGLLFGKNRWNAEILAPLVEQVRCRMAWSGTCDYFFPLGLGEHADHLVVKYLGLDFVADHRPTKPGDVQPQTKALYFYEDIWPLPKGVQAHFANTDILEIPQYVLEIAAESGMRLEACFQEIDIQETIEMAAVYFSETSAMKKMLSHIIEYTHSKKDGKHYVRYWKVL